jgi:hypothetical protein
MRDYEERRQRNRQLTQVSCLRVCVFMRVVVVVAVMLIAVVEFIDDLCVYTCVCGVCIHVCVVCVVCVWRGVCVCVRSVHVRV